MVFVTDFVVGAVLDHHPHALLGTGGQTPAFGGLGKPEIHRQGIIEDNVFLNVQVGHRVFARLVFTDDFDGGAQADVKAPVD